jgi:hypothetical protein
VFASQYQQRPEAGGTGYCSIERLARYAEAPPFELIVHSWDIASTNGGGLDGLRQIRPGQGIGRPVHSLPYRHRPHAKRAARRPRGDHRARLARQAGDHRYGRQRHRQRPLPGLVGQRDGGTFCPASLWQARPPTTSRSAASAKVYSTSTMAWCAFRMRCRGSKPCSPNERGSPTRPIAMASSSAESCCRPPRSRSSRPNRAIRSSTTGDNGLTRSQEATFTRKSFRCWLRRHRADFDPPYREATSATPANGARAEQPRRGRRSRSKAQAASMLRVLTGEERDS